MSNESLLTASLIYNRVVVMKMALEGRLLKIRDGGAFYADEVNDLEAQIDVLNAVLGNGKLGGL